jgi:hypothetical protein
VISCDVASQRYCGPKYEDMRNSKDNTDNPIPTPLRERSTSLQRRLTGNGTILPKSLWQLQPISKKSDSFSTVIMPCRMRKSTMIRPQFGLKAVGSFCKASITSRTGRSCKGHRIRRERLVSGRVRSCTYLERVDLVVERF